MPLPPGVSQFDPAAYRREPRPFPSAAGYGLEAPPGTFQPSHPVLSLQACIQAAQACLASTMQQSSLAPWHTQPQRSNTRCEFARAVLNVPAAVNAAANAAGLVLAAANSTIVPITVLTPTAANEPLTFFTLSPEARAQMLRLKSWGITVVNAPDEALRTGVVGATVGGVPSPPNPSISSHVVELQQDATAMVNENKTLEVTVQNLTTPLASATALLIFFGVCWWEYDMTRYTDNPNKMRLQSGFGPECHR